MTSKKAFYIHLEKVYVSLLTELLTEIKNTNLKSIESVFYCEKFFLHIFYFFLYTTNVWFSYSERFLYHLQPFYRCFFFFREILISFTRTFL